MIVDHSGAIWQEGDSNHPCLLLPWWSMMMMAMMVIIVVGNQSKQHEECL